MKISVEDLCYIVPFISMILRQVIGYQLNQWRLNASSMPLVEDKNTELYSSNVLLTISGRDENTELNSVEKYVYPITIQW